MRDFHKSWVEALVATFDDAHDSRNGGVSAIPTLTAQVKAQEGANEPLVRDDLHTLPMHMSPKVAAMWEEEERNRAMVKEYLTRTELPLFERGYLSARCVMMKPKAGMDEYPPNLPPIPNRYEILCGDSIVFTSECILQAGSRFEDLVIGCNLA